MDLAMLFGTTFLSLANGPDDADRKRALDMLAYFSERDTFSPAEREIMRTMTQMANDVFLDGKGKVTPCPSKPRPKPDLRIVN
jgi:hypothetical protein